MKILQYSDQLIRLSSPFGILKCCKEALSMISTHGFHPVMESSQLNLESDSFCFKKGLEKVFLMSCHDLFITNH